MKTKRFAKIATLVLAVMLIVAAAVGINVSADSAAADTVAIEGKNVVYQGELRIVYYVDAPNFNPETQKLRMNFWIAAATGKADYINDFNPNVDENFVEKDGKTYYAIFSDGIAPVHMTKPIYCQPVIENNDGTIAAVAEQITEYSVYTYAMNRFSQGPTPDQLTLYKALLDYGAAVQSIFPDDAQTDVYGWADAYYAATANIYINGEKTENTISSVGKRAIDLVDADGVYRISSYSDSYNGAMYLKTTKQGELEKASNVVAPGYQAYDLYFTDKGAFEDFETTTDVNKLFEGGSANEWAEFVGINLNTAYDEAVSNKGYINVSDIVNKSGAVNKAMTFGLAANDTSAHGTYWMIDINDGQGLTSNEIGHTYIVDFDFQILSSGKQTSANEILRMTLTNNKGSITEGDKIFLHGLTHLYNRDANKSYIGSKAGVDLSHGQWYDVRYEYTIISETTSKLTLYVDGEEVYVANLDTVIAPEAFYMQMQRSATKQEYAIDNLWYYDYTTFSVGQGKYYKETLASNKTGATVITFDNKNNITYGANNVTLVDGAASSQTTGTWHDYKITANNVTTADGEKFIIEFDYMVKSTNTTADNIYGYIKIKSGESYLGALSMVECANGFKVGASCPLLSLNEWYNIRIEITDDAGAYYVNDIKISDFSFQGGQSATGYANNINIVVENRNTSTGCVYLIDNLVIDNADTNNFDYYDKYQAGQLSENTVVADFNDTEAGVEDYLFAPNEVFTDVNKRPGDSDTDRKYTLIEDGAWVIGTQGISSATEKKEAYDRIELGFTDIDVGSKIVVEYDYKFVKIGDRVTSDGRSLSVGFGKTDKTEAKRTHEMWTNYKSYINPDNNSNGNGVFYFTAGEWNKLRIEVVTGESSYTVTYFVNGTQKYTETFNSSLTSVESFVFYLGNYAYQEHAIDNFVATIIAPAAE